MLKFFTSLLPLFFIQNIYCQTYILTGKVSNNKLEPLAFATVQIKGSPLFTQTKENGTYTLTLEKGEYEIVVSLVGYKVQVFKIALLNNDKLNIVLEQNILANEEATVIGQKKDKSEQLIKKVIEHKDDILAVVKNYSANVYIRATENNKSIKTLKNNVNFDNNNQSIEISSKKKNVTDTANKDIAAMRMAEIQMILDVELPNHKKETRNGVKKLGNPENLFYLTTTDGDFNLYNNLLRIPAIGEVPFVSPISYSGLIAYKYKTIRTRKANGRTFYTISFKPSAMGNTLLTGEVEIMDSTWVVIASNFNLPKYHLNEYDFFNIVQEYQFVNDTAWLLKKQQFNYGAKEGKRTMNGTTNVLYNSYELNKNFPKKYFGVEKSTTSKEAYERDTTYWQQVRTQPLTKEELRFVRYKDSMYHATHTKAYLDSIDAKLNKITPLKILTLGITFYKRPIERTIRIGSLTEMLEPLQPGGTRIGYNVNYNKIYKNKKNIWVNTFFSYGIRNKDLNGTLSFSRMYNPFNRGYYFGNIGRSFDQLFEGDILYQSFQKRNLYRKNNLTLGHGLELLNGLFLTNKIEIARRESLANMKFANFSDFTTDSATLNLLNFTNKPRDFKTENVLYNIITLSYTPYQEYMREPLQKVILGSKWPTISATWRKGIPNILSSGIKYDYVEASIAQTLKLGTVGVSKYAFIVGSFPNRDSLQILDKKFMRGSDPGIFFLPERNFQNLDSTFELTRVFYEGHYLHEFNGAILNKIPLLKKLNLRELAGGGFLIAPERNLKYFEAFFGIESMPFRLWTERFKIGVFGVTSISNKNNQPFQLKFSIRHWDKHNNKWQ